MIGQEAELTRDDPQLAPLLDSGAVAALLGVPVETVTTWRHRNQGPSFLRIGRHVRYDPAEINRWLQSRRNVPRGA